LLDQPVKVAGLVAPLGGFCDFGFGFLSTMASSSFMLSSTNHTIWTSSRACRALAPDGQETWPSRAEIVLFSY
jgi:hypothetical protein